MLNKFKVTWGKLSLFTHYWGFFSRKHISKYFKLTQHVSKYFKLTQNILRNLFKSLRNYIMDEQWINFIHYDGGMKLRMSFVTPLRSLKKTIVITIFINPNYGKYVTFLLNLLRGIFRFSTHFTTCMWSCQNMDLPPPFQKQLLL
jgi:hypothetical protein